GRARGGALPPWPRRDVQRGARREYGRRRCRGGRQARRSGRSCSRACRSPTRRLCGRPVLFIASQEEPTVAQVTEQYRRAPRPKRIVLLPGAAHGQYILGTDQAGSLRTTVAEFLEAREVL